MLDTKFKVKAVHIKVHRMVFILLLKTWILVFAVYIINTWLVTNTIYRLIATLPSWPDYCLSVRKSVLIMACILTTILIKHGDWLHLLRENSYSHIVIVICHTGLGRIVIFIQWQISAMLVKGIYLCLYSDSNL